jgi:hypothetical protein
LIEVAVTPRDSVAPDPAADAGEVAALETELAEDEAPLEGLLPLLLHAVATNTTATPIRARRVRGRMVATPTAADL